MINEAKKEAIREEAKQILKKFAKTLENVNFKEKAKKKEAGGFRVEGAGQTPDENFRERMFANALNKTEDCIIAEKKEW